MSLHHTSLEPAGQPITTSAGRPRLHGRILIWARRICIVGVVVTLVIYFASIPPYFEQLQVLCSSTACLNSGQLSLSDVRGLHAAGFSLTFYASFTIGTLIVSMLIWSGVAALLLWRKFNDPMALFTAFTLVAFSSIQSNTLYALPSSFTWIVTLLRFLGSTCIGLFFYLFPSGRFEPRWMRWIGLGSIIYWVVDISFLDSVPLNSLLGGVSVILFIGFVGSIIGVQVYRYRRVSDTGQRQRTKWVVFGVALAFGGYLGVALLGFFFPALQQGVVGNLFLGTAFGLFLLFIPLSIGFAILRSRLWDIDVIINRTLIYGLLTSSLLLIFFGLVATLQFLLGGIISSNNDVALVASTLVIYALFQPLRRRIQAIIDRRFYRRKYDAARTVAEFSAILRSEVDLNQLSEHLLTVVQETMQPTHVSLWLQQPVSLKETQRFSPE